MGLESTILDEESGSELLDEYDDFEDENDGDEDLQPLDLNGVYEGISAFFIDVDAIDGSSGSVFANDTCLGDLTIEIDVDKNPSVFGRGDCVLQNFGIQGRGELAGNVDIYTGEIEGWISLTLDTDPVEVEWNGLADEDMVTGEFEGSLPFSDTSYNLELDYLGEFQADR
jgi:hypothetical protein